MRGEFGELSFLLWPLLSAPDYEATGFSHHWSRLSTPLAIRPDRTPADRILPTDPERAGRTRRPSLPPAVLPAGRGPGHRLRRAVMAHVRTIDSTPGRRYVLTGTYNENVVSRGISPTSGRQYLEDIGKYSLSNSLAEAISDNICKIGVVLALAVTVLTGESRRPASETMDRRHFRGDDPDGPPAVENVYLTVRCVSSHITNVSGRRIRHRKH